MNNVIPMWYTTSTVIAVKLGSMNWVVEPGEFMTEVSFTMEPLVAHNTILTPDPNHFCPTL